ncbi:hypothetical protein B0H16DRAFT_1710169 [Mycena metata]|uniref:Uncharacterized protein n=1 Tax=Mycena metata TaxID=1033252 RepID=A0AAD7K906_9AGAR|nr:hypothetical protein B0H16DRAFT_1710169 [Mycena metata]
MVQQEWQHQQNQGMVGRSKSVGGGRSMDVPQYADGYVSQYQTHSNNRGHRGEDAYGGLKHSQCGHIVGMDDEESDGEGDGRRVLKFANE